MTGARVLAGLALLLASGPQAGMCESSPHTPIRSTRGASAERVLEVPAGADLQAALDDAQPGDTLVLAAGATFDGPFTLPRKSGSSWITIQSSALDRLPRAGTRVSPKDAQAMPKLEANGDFVLATAPAAHHYRLIGIEIRAHGSPVTDLVRLGSPQQSKREIPANLELQRCYLHGDPDFGSRRGLAMNSSSTSVEDSYFADFKEVGADSQAIASWNGPGPFRLINNYFEGAGENVMFGGADPSIKGLVPSDIEVRGNRFAKPVAWKTQPSESKSWSVKNLFELKNARRVVVVGNLFENNWVQSQSGFGILFTVRNQEGHAPWSVVEDVTFAHNVLRHSAAGISILGQDNNAPSQRTQRIRITNNLFDDIGGARWGGGGTLLQLIGGTADVSFEHNTAFHTDNVIMAEGPPHTHFVFANNIVQQNQYGIVGTGTAPGQPTLAAYFPGARVEGNVFVGGAEATYPARNFFPASLIAAGLSRAAGAWPRLLGNSRYHGAATDGRDVGADADTLQAIR